MAEFKLRNLSVLNYAQGFTMWHYRHATGLISEPSQRGFFNPVNDMLQPGDMIAVSASNGGAMLFVDAATDGVVLTRVMMATVGAPELALTA